MKERLDYSRKLREAWNASKQWDIGEGNDVQKTLLRFGKFNGCIVNVKNRPEREESTQNCLNYRSNKNFRQSQQILKTLFGSQAMNNY